jgi:hypothetical protein
MPSLTTRLLLILGRSTGFVGAALTVALMAWWGRDLFRYALFSEDPTWDEVGVIPFVVVLRIIVAAWVAWVVVRLDGRTLLLALLAASGCSFLLLYGWYFLLTGMDWNFLYWVVGADLLYLVAASMVGCALLLPAAGVHPHNDGS